jgi:hypothetical protein
MYSINKVTENQNIMSHIIIMIIIVSRLLDGFGGLVVPEFAGSNPAEAVGFFCT